MRISIQPDKFSLFVLLISTMLIFVGCSGIPKTKTVEVFADGVEATAKAIEELHKLEVASIYDNRLEQNIDSNLLNQLSFNREACENKVKDCVITYKLNDPSATEVTLGSTNKILGSHKKILVDILIYSKLLKGIATSDDAKEFDEQIKALRKSTDSIFSELEALGKNKENPAGKESYESYMNLVEKLITFIGNQYINYKRMAVLREAIDKGSTVIPPAVEVLKDVVDDSWEIVAGDAALNFSQTTIEAYNSGMHPETGKSIENKEQRIAALRYVQTELIGIRTKIASNPAASIQKIESNLENLKEEINKKNVDFSQLFIDTEKFYKEAKEIHEALEEL